MTNSGDAAEQIVRMSLEGTEVALRLTGSAAKNIAAALYTIAKNADRNKTKGRLIKVLTTNMIRLFSTIFHIMGPWTSLASSPKNRSKLYRVKPSMEGT